ncbi:unannotated protein [freshwater metagenome]|uniref:Unannotated protein n=1 Tax=freshwater metagenome TaxID=449393 RepID=A0A6J7K2V6_9ZZZZ
MVDPATIFGREPAFSVDNASAFVFARHLFTAKEDKPRFAYRKDIAVFVTNFDLDTRKHLAHRTKSNLGDGVTSKCGVVILGTEQGNGRRGFRQAIGVHETSSDEQLERLFKNREWHARAAIRKRCQHRGIGR